MKVTDLDVRKALREREDEVVNDIQHLLEGSCPSDCMRCVFQYLCIREKDV